LSPHRLISETAVLCELLVCHTFVGRVHGRAARDRGPSWRKRRSRPRRNRIAPQSASSRVNRGSREVLLPALELGTGFAPTIPTESARM